MLDCGARLATVCSNGGLIFFAGNLGMGKTTLCRGLIKALGHRGAVKSPTYTLVEPYSLGSLSVYHFDLYRLGHAEELEYMGIRDYFAEQSLCLVEWSERGEGVLPQADLVVAIDAVNGGRVIDIRAESAKGLEMLGKLR